MAQLQIQRMGYRVEVAADGPAGLARLAEGDIALVLLDVMMPGLDGRQVCRAVRAREGVSYVPIIMLTGLGGDAARHAGFDAGADDYLTKPYQLTELRDRVAVWLRVGAHMGLAASREAGAGATRRPTEAEQAPPVGAAALEQAILGQVGREHALVQEAQRSPLFVAAVLIPYARAQGWDESELAEQVGCPPATLARLLLRRRPEPLTWEADVTVMAAACGADPRALARVLQAAEAWARGARH
jgi:CheY-like chemotaxis protein